MLLELSLVIENLTIERTTLSHTCTALLCSVLKLLEPTFGMGASNCLSLDPENRFQTLKLLLASHVFSETRTLQIAVTCNMLIVTMEVFVI